MALLQIPRIKSPSPSSFITEYLEPGRPVVLDGIVEMWPAVRKWSSQYLADIAGDTEVELRCIDLARWPSTFMRRGKTSFRNYLADLESGNQSNFEDGWPPLRLAEIPVQALSSTLAMDIGESPYGKSAPHNLSIMVSSGTTAALHYHPRSEAISYQLQGSRRFILAPPSETHHMDPMPVEGPLANFGRRVFSEDDLDQRGVELHDATLAAGDAIFIPIHWWHTVFSGKGLSVLAVDFFRHHHSDPSDSAVAHRVEEGDRRYRKQIEELKPQLEGASNSSVFFSTIERMLEVARWLDDIHLEASLLKRGLAALPDDDPRRVLWQSQTEQSCKGCRACVQK